MKRLTLVAIVAAVLLLSSAASHAASYFSVNVGLPGFGFSYYGRHYGVSVYAPPIYYSAPVYAAPAPVYAPAYCYPAPVCHPYPYYYRAYPRRYCW